MEFSNYFNPQVGQWTPFVNTGEAVDINGVGHE